MNRADMLRLSWRAWLHHGAPRVGPWWIGHVWTVVFALAVAAGFSVISLVFSSHETMRTSWPTIIAASILMSLAISFSVRFAFWLARRSVGAERLAQWPGGLRSLYF
ncbi:MAG: hypothetical protein M3154_12160, partial [Candidatus Eremiobacteraeota bacterium]|nr:hypothetical protein [Candidatus Eremiobacteraeota bacterium]